MTGADIEYFKMCFTAGLVKEPFLEVGSAIVQAETELNLCGLARKFGLTEISGTDLQMGNGVDFTTDFALSPDEFKKGWKRDLFETVAIFNVLEHTFDPITIMKNVVACTKPGGTILVIVPSVWPIHNYPKDYTRLLPNWFEELGQQLKLEIDMDRFCFLSEFGLTKISDSETGSQYNLPNYLRAKQGKSTFRFWKSRITHRLFNTYGRSHMFTSTAIGCTYVVK